MWDTIHWMMTLSDSTSLNEMSSGLTGSTGSKWMEESFKSILINLWDSQTSEIKKDGGRRGDRTSKSQQRSEGNMTLVCVHVREMDRTECEATLYTTHITSGSRYDDS